MQNPNEKLRDARVLKVLTLLQHQIGLSVEEIANAVGATEATVIDLTREHALSSAPRVINNILRMGARFYLIDFMESDKLTVSKVIFREKNKLALVRLNYNASIFAVGIGIGKVGITVKKDKATLVRGLKAAFKLWDKTKEDLKL